MAVYDAVKRQVVLQFACGANSLDDQAGRKVLQEITRDLQRELGKAASKEYLTRLEEAILRAAPAF